MFFVIYFMEDDSIYNVIIISLIIGIIVVIATLVVAKPEKEKFTELYFNNHENLEEYDYDGEIDFSFTISNFEGEQSEYKYEILVNNQKVKEGNVNVRNNGSAVVNEKVNLDIPFDRTKISVNLPEKDQEIHFWTKFTNKVWLKYEGMEDAAINCLPNNEVNYGDIIIVKMRGSEADGLPLMEILVNGKKENEIYVNEETSEYIVYGPIEEDVIIDLIFVNDYGKKENGEVIADRNIYIYNVRTTNKNLNYVYDKDKLDCEDLREGNMNWNGALRFRVTI